MRTVVPALLLAAILAGCTVRAPAPVEDRAPIAAPVTTAPSPVEVKPARELSPRDIQRENPEFRTLEDVLDLLSRIYDRPVTADDIVTIIYFSPVDEYGLDGI
jgi:hypothetical protein